MAGRLREKREPAKSRGLINETTKHSAIETPGPPPRPPLGKSCINSRTPAYLSYCNHYFLFERGSGKTYPEPPNLIPSAHPPTHPGPFEQDKSFVQICPSVSPPPPHPPFASRPTGLRARGSGRSAYASCSYRWNYGTMDGWMTKGGGEGVGVRSAV